MARTELQRNIPGWKRLVLAVAVLSAFAGVASPAAAQAWQQYWGLANGYMPVAPTYAHSSGSANQSIYTADLESCSSGTWTKRITIETSSAVIYNYQSTGCGQTGPGSYAIANTRSACAAITSGSWGAYCYVLRD